MATVPSPPTYTVGQVLTSAEMNAISAAFNFFLNPPRAQLRQTVAQSIPNNTVTALLFDTEDQDTDNMHSTVSATSRLTVVTPGTYLLTASSGTVGVATGYRTLRFQKNGVGTPGRVDQAGTTTDGFNINASHILSAVAGDYFEVAMLQNSGSAMNTNDTSPDLGCTFGALWIGT